MNPTVRCLGLLCLMGCAASGQSVSLRLGPFHPTNSSTVEFTVTPTGTAPADSLTPLNLRSTPSDSGHSTLLLDLGSLRRSKFNRFIFDVYVDGPEGRRSSVPKYTVAEDPTGQFCDQNRAVPFHNFTSAGDDAGSASVPLHPSYGSDCLSMKLAESPLPVELGGPSTKEITLTSNYDNLQTTLTAATVRVDCTRCWRLPASAAPPQAPLAPQASAALTLSLQPNTLYTLFAKAMIMKPDKSQDQLHVRVESLADQGGAVTSQEFSVPVRFTPPLVVLLPCVGIGAFLGALLGWKIVPQPQDAPARRFLGGTTFVAMGIAILVWLMALTAFSLTDTRLVIGGASLDPSQLIPAFLIAALAAGGTPVINRIKEVWGK